MRGNSELVNAAREGDPTAYEELVRRYSQVVLTTAWHLLGDYHAAEDVAQEAFLAAYQKLHTLRNCSLFGPWVVKITQRLACRSNDRRVTSHTLEAAPAPVTNTEPGALDDEMQVLLAAVTRLPEHERVVVTLRYVEGHSVQSIADMTERPLGTVTKQLSRALRRLQKLLKEVEA